MSIPAWAYVAGVGGVAIAAPSLARRRVPAPSVLSAGARSSGALVSALAEPPPSVATGGGVLVASLGGPEWVPPGGVNRVVTHDTVARAVREGMAAARRAPLDPRPDGVQRGYAQAVQAANAWAARMLRPEDVDHGAAAMLDTLATQVLASGGGLLSSVGCDRVVPLITSALIAGPAGVTIAAPDVATGRTARPGAADVLQLAATWGTASPDAALLATASFAASAVGALAGWACRLGLAYGLDLLEATVRELAGAAARPLLALYRVSGAQWAVNRTSAVTREAFARVADGVGGVLGPIARELHLAAVGGFLADVAGDVARPLKRAGGVVKDAAGWVEDKFNPFD